MKNYCYKHRNQFLATDNVCGNFRFSSDNAHFTVWDSKEIIPLGTVSIFHNGDDENSLIVTVTDSRGNIDTFLVPPRNTRSRTYANLVSVHLTCSGSRIQFCEGRYCLHLHYLV
ncbi:hypothetical protein CAI16_14770 [Virgibacillus dokdonensis]|uniref:Endospore appendages core domain-containing protein n=1 Tax=Virgibacillus dokdonensis TaxID=302167 RepID=A0A3E0WMX3_9BACI|nr:S-Ena type endospore appendage [Virgibacillus dokdonensis]RFA33407.1 hypothetical protein CAI16_14770 [Virgibacillus dokdonensis]